MQPQSSTAQQTTDPTAQTTGTGAAETASEPFNWDTESIIRLVEQYGIPALKVLILIIAALLIASWVRRMTTRALERAHVETTLARFGGNGAKWAIYLVAGIMAISIFGIETVSFAAVFAAVGFAIGMALEGSLGNIAAGVMLLIFRPFKVGDVVSAAGITGKVFEIELFTTAVDTFDNRRFIIPNSAIFGSTIENITYHDTRRADVNVGVEYSADLDRTREVLMAAAKSVEGILAEPEPAVFLSELGGSSVNWVVRVWCPAPEFWNIKQALTRAVKMHLDDAGLGIPFPQMDVHLDGLTLQTT